ncbi:MAG: 50S ribosomal protein L10 [Candidatus Nanoarchaeia archaeon]|jgi:large subunit ribosomal protein L10|nr:50S ribosomal protein L10 [Candidatus Nanoarchaeia archaeon]|tara:strand:- start:4462 stop:5598 length:1137 start_codon:yes stop_codon:yes gene_type:complete
MKRKIQQKKLKEVEEIKNLANKYSVLGLVDMTNLPSLQLQRMRQQLRNTLYLKMAKKRLIRIALNQLKDKENIKEFNDKLKGEAALIFTNENPFKLAKLLGKEKSSAPAKAGQEAPNDIIIPAGPTNFTPGPVIGELGQLGIKTEVKDGKIAIKEDKLLVKEGEVIDKKAAEILSRLGVEPMQVGLNLIAAYEKGIIYLKDILSVDEESYVNNLKQLGLDSFNLAMHIGYTTKDTINQLIQKAFRDSNSLAESKDIVTSESIKKELSKVDKEAEVLKEKLNIEVSETKKEQVKEKVEESKKEEIKEEKVEVPKEKLKEVKEAPKETKEITTEELLKDAEEETKEDREKLEKEKKDKEDIKKAEEKLKELTDKAIQEKK